MSRARIDPLRSFLLLLGAAVVCPLAGCERSERASVSGHVVRHDGTPVQGVTVIARCDETGNWASGTTDADGRYTLGAVTAGDGVPPGEYFVVVIEDANESARPTVPAKYQNPTTSGLRLTVDKKRTEYDIRLDPS